jgi:2-polyprenyl-3-methyl-5-hydroxy-6-metoxy-1,4-benzoquinol methylase
VKVDARTVNERLAGTPSFRRIVDLVGAANPLQRKRVAALLAAQDGAYFDFAESMSRSLDASFLRDPGDARAAVAAYDELCFEMLREQIRFRKTGLYRLDDARDANETVYSDPIRMERYLIGLMLTYLFWPNHYELFRLFQRGLAGIAPGTVLEVGAGHGLFTAEVLRTHPTIDLTVLDISESSMSMTRAFLEALETRTSAVRFLLGDFMGPALGLASFDLIVMGEVIEHVNDAPALLRRARELMTPGGRLFVTTCANCPAADHIYYFGSADQIRTVLSDAGFTVDQEIVLPAEAVPEARWEEEKVTVNYGAFLKHASEPDVAGGTARR